MTLGNRLARARKRLKLTQEQIADQFGVSKQAVSQWERDETTPEPDKLANLRQTLRVTFAYLLLGVGDPPQPNDPMVLLEDRITAEYKAMGEREPPSGKTTRRRA